MLVIGGAIIVVIVVCRQCMKLIYAWKTKWPLKYFKRRKLPVPGAELMNSKEYFDPPEFSELREMEEDAPQPSA